jgi:sterol desaturase/sphingolipid hydroxylase (fatty acid hydroxylase superfamily)
MFEVARSMTVPFLVASIAFMVLELLYFRWRGKSFHRLKDTLCNLSILIVGRLSQPLFVGYIYGSLKLVENFKFFQIPDNVGTTLAAIVLTDLSYYFEHRWSHKTRFLWFFHEVHHSSKNFNLTTSFRLHWLGRLTAPIIFAPLILLGFKTEQVVIFFIANLFYQFFLHTRAIGKLGFLEGIINTPSAHRVHHARNKIYVDKNFGGILMIWDRLFGTYRAETEEPEFGILGKFESNNPIVVQFHNLPGAGWLSALSAPATKLIAASLSALFVTGAGTVSFAEPVSPLESRENSGQNIP